MLIGNGSVLHKNPGRALGGVAESGYRWAWNTTGPTRCQYVGGFDPAASTPSGYRPPYTAVLPIKSGWLASFTIIGGSGALSTDVAGGVNGAATLAGSGDLTGAAALIVSAVAALSGTGGLSASAVAYLNAAADLAGSGDLAGAATALGYAVAGLSGVAAVTITARASGAMAADITLAGAELSPDAVASAVWASAEGALLVALQRNRVVTDPDTGTYTVYDDDDVTPLYTATLWQDAAGTIPYAGSGADRRDRLA